MIQNFSVVIPTYNRHKVLVETVRSLCAGTVVPSQIIIIDQTDEVIKMSEFSKMETPEILIVSEKIKSSTHARNVGIQKAKENIILFCDDDILLKKTSLEILWNQISKPNIALVSAINYKDNLVHTHTKANLLKDFVGTVMGMKKCWRKDGYVVKSNLRGRYSAQIDKTVNTEWAMGYFFCVKKEILECMDQWFDENLVRYAYAEDLDLTYRYCKLAKEKGYQTVVCPEIYVNHLASKEWRTPKKEEILYIFANRRYLSYKLFPNKGGYRIAMNLFDRMYEFSQCKNNEYRKMIHAALKMCHENKKDIQHGRISQLVEKLK